LGWREEFALMFLLFEFPALALRRLLPDLLFDAEPLLLFPPPVDRFEALLLLLDLEELLLLFLAAPLLLLSALAPLPFP
jgi:hypothetical protein